MMKDADTRTNGKIFQVSVVGLGGLKIMLYKVKQSNHIINSTDERARVYNLACMAQHTGQKI